MKYEPLDVGYCSEINSFDYSSPKRDHSVIR